MDVANAVFATYQDLYAATYARFDSDLWFFVATISFAHGATLFLTSLGFLSLDANPGLFDAYRLQEKRPPDALFATALKGLVFNSLVTYPVFAALLYPLTGNRISIEGALPDVAGTFKQLLFCMVVEDCLFYWIHRLLHHPAIYGAVHKKHHEFKQNRAPSAEYFHPVEDVLNVIPFIAGPLLQGMHLSTFLLWVVVRVNEIVDAHSGYGVPWSPWSWTRPSERHEYHHSHNIGCYGSYFPFWDRLMGTDAHFRKFLENGAWRHAKKAEKPAEPPAPEPSARPDIAAPPPPPADGSPTATTTLRRNPGRACKSPVRYNK